MVVRGEAALLELNLLGAWNQKGMVGAKRGQGRFFVAVRRENRYPGAGRSDSHTSGDQRLREAFRDAWGPTPRLWSLIRAWHAKSSLKA